MTVSSVLNRTTLTGNGATTNIPVTFPFSGKADLVVLSTVIATGVSTTQTHLVDYTITGSVDALGHYSTGGTVVMTVAPASTVTITVYRDPARTQGLDLANGGSFQAESVESQFDYITMLVQRLSDRMDRTVRQPDGDTANIIVLPAKVTRASAFLSFDSNGDPIASTSISTTGVSTFMATVLDDTSQQAAQATLGTPRYVADRKSVV